MKFTPVVSYADYRCVRKDGTKYPEMNIVAKEEINLRDPVLILSGSTDEMLRFNYAVIDWDEKDSFPTIVPYFVVSKDMMPGGLYRVVLHIDVLMYYGGVFGDMANGTSQTELGYVTRSWANIPKSRLFADPNITIGGFSPETQSIVKFPQNKLISWDNPYFILTVAGSYGVFHDTEG